MHEDERALERFIGERIRTRRIELGFTQEELARDLDISYQQIQKYERGANRISASRLLSLARRMTVPITYFYSGFDPSLDESRARAKDLAVHAGRKRTSIEIARHTTEIEHDQTRLALNSLAKAIVDRQA